MAKITLLGSNPMLQVAALWLPPVATQWLPSLGMRASHQRDAATAAALFPPNPTKGTLPTAQLQHLPHSLRSLAPERAPNGNAKNSKPLHHAPTANNPQPSHLCPAAGKWLAALSPRMYWAVDTSSA